MGGCCAGEDGHEIKMGGKQNKGKGATQDIWESRESDNIFDYANDTVKRILHDLGEFDAGKFSGESVEKPLASLENNAKYVGGWSKGSDPKRCGTGIQAWSDGSVYQGHWRDDKANG